MVIWGDCSVCGGDFNGPNECNCQMCDICLGQFRDEETLVDRETNTRMCAMCAEELIERLRGR